MTNCDKSLCLQIILFLLSKNIIKKLLIVKLSVPGPFIQLNTIYHCLKLTILATKKITPFVS